MAMIVLDIKPLYNLLNMKIAPKIRFCFAMLLRGRILFLFLAVWFASLSGFATENISLGSKDRYAISHFEFLIDTGQNFKIQDVVGAYADGKFKKCINEIEIDPKNNYWLRFELCNHNAFELMWTLHFGVQFSHIWLYPYTKQDDIVRPISADSVIAEVSTSINTIALPVYYNQQNIYYVKLHNTFAGTFTVENMYLRPLRTEKKAWMLSGFELGGVLGGVFVMLLVAISLYIQNHRSVFFYYIFYIFFALLYFIVDSFIGQYFIFSNNAMLCFKGHIFILLSSMFYLPFISKITINEKNSKINRYFLRPVIIFLIVNNVFLSFILFFEQEYMKELLFFSTLLYVTFTLIYAVLAWRTAPIIGKIALCGTLFMLLGAITASLVSMLNNVESNFLFNFGFFAELLIFTYAMSRHQKNIEREMQSQQLMLLESQHVLDNNHRELTQKALLITRHEQFLDKLKEQLGDIKVENTKIRETLVNIVNDVDIHTRQGSWSEFEKYFTEVHPSFFVTIKDKYPLLSQHELRTCALVKLKLTTKEIASLTQKTVKSVEVTRYRIRQKLDLSIDDNLSDFLSKF